MNGLSVQMVFSPQSCSLDWLDKTLTSDLRRLGERISGRIESSIRTQTSHYSLVIGPRGSGKTHLLTYIRKKFQARYANDPSVKIICLSEEERGITSLLDFLVACLRAAGIPAEQVASRILNTDHPTPLEAALNFFHEVAGRESTLIVVENLSDIFDSLQEEALADLRGFFQDNPSVSLFASSVSLFANSSKADHPFYGFFNIHPLKPLDRTAAKTYLAILAQAKGDNNLVVALEKDEAQARVNAIYDLTGGNPRLLAMLSTFLSADGLAELVGPFVEMADRELTPYYQQRLDRLTPHQNRLLRAIADHHGRALSVSEIARFTFLTPQSVSRQLYDLLHGGYVARNQIGRESCYELAEPLLRLVLDIKEGRDRPLPLIVNLLKNWYSVQELRRLGSMVPKQACLYYNAAVVEKEGLRAKKGVLLASELRVGVVRRGADEIARAAKALFKKGVRLGQLKRGKEAIAVYEELLERFGDSDRPELLDVVANALFFKGVTLGDLNRNEEAIGVYDEVVERFGDSDRPELLGVVADALFFKGVPLGDLNRNEEAIGVYDEVVERFGDSDRPELLKQVAKALVRKAATLSQLNRNEEAVAVCDQVVERFGDSDSPQFFESVANALVGKGVTLGELNRNEEAIGVYDEVVERFGDSDSPQLLKHVANALVGKGVLGIWVRPAEALAAFDSALRIQPDNPAALGTRIEALAYLRREDEALGSLDEMLKRVPEAHWSRMLIVSQLLNVNSFLGDENLVREVIALYKDDKDSLVSGLISWIQNQIPLSTSAAGELEMAEKTLRSAFAQIPEAAYALQMLSAIREDALGDRKALLSLPVELRRLVESSKEKTVKERQ